MFLQKYLAAIEAKEDFNMSTLDACNILQKTLFLIQITIKNCSSKAGLINSTLAETSEDSYSTKFLRNYLTG